MLECKEIRPLLPDYAAGNLTEEAVRQVEDHLLLCPICAGELERLQAEQYRPSVMQPMGLPRTTPPETPKKAPAAGEDPVPQSPAEPEAQQEAPPVPEEDEAPKKKSPMSRRSKVIFALAVPVVLLGILLALLISRDVFSIRDRVRSADKSWTAVMYRGTDTGADTGFRIRLWTDGDWERETVFHGMEYKQMVWSPDGRFLALEFLDQNEKSSIYVMDTQRQREGGISSVLEDYLTKREGLFGNSFLTDVPACTILQWLPDSSALLVAGEGVVDTDVDPDYGIQFAGSGTEKPEGWIEFNPNTGDHTEIDAYIDPDLTTVSGYFAYVPETGQIQNIIGFGTPAYDGEDTSGQSAT